MLPRCTSNVSLNCWPRVQIMTSLSTIYITLASVLARPSDTAPPAISSSPQQAATTLGPPHSSINAAVSDYVGFVGDPNGRGTTSVVISCLLTLIMRLVRSTSQCSQARRDFAPIAGCERKMDNCWCINPRACGLHRLAAMEFCKVAG